MGWDIRDLRRYSNRIYDGCEECRVRWTIFCFVLLLIALFIFSVL